MKAVLLVAAAGAVAVASPLVAQKPEPKKDSSCTSSAGKTECRMYWQGADDSASRRYTREYIMAQLRDVHAEDRAVIEAGQRGLESGAIKHIHFQPQEVLCRHFFSQVSERVEAYRAELAGNGPVGLSAAAE